MWASRYFNRRYWAARFFPRATQAVVPPVVSPVDTGGSGGAAYVIDLRRYMRPVVITARLRGTLARPGARLHASTANGSTLRGNLHSSARIRLTESIPAVLRTDLIGRPSASIVVEQTVNSTLNGHAPPLTLHDVYAALGGRVKALENERDDLLALLLANN